MTKHSDRYYKDLKRFKGYKHLIWGTMSFHHFSYSHLRSRYSIYWINGVYLPVWFHVPIMHILLGGGNRAGSQLFGKYPNILQRSAHLLCRIHFSLVPIGLFWLAFKIYSINSGQ